MLFPFNYFLFDAARAESNLYTAIEQNPNYKSLYKGTAEEDLEGVAPYLFTIAENTPFADWYLNEGWGQSWGTLLFSNYPFEQLYTHFRKFLMVKTEDEEELYFRFYDPRVLRIFLPTCDEKQLREFFGPVEYFICEDEDPGYALVFSFAKNQLQTKRVAKEEVFEQSEANKTGRKFFI